MFAKHAQGQLLCLFLTHFGMILSDRHAPLIDSPAATRLFMALIRAIFSEFVKRRLLALLVLVPLTLNPMLAVATSMLGV